jgi:hypothetical protein
MKKIIVLYPYKFTKFNFFQFGYDLLEKKIKIEIHDLSDLFVTKKFAIVWEVSSYYKKILTFKSFLSWFLYIIKVPKSTIILNDTFVNFNSIYFFLIKLVLSVKGFVVFVYDVLDVVIARPKKNSYYFFHKIFIEHKYDFLFYFNFLKKILFFNLAKIFEYNKKVILTNKNNKIVSYSKHIIIKGIHSFDYSNFLRKKNIHSKYQKYFVYLDTGFPYFSGDALLDRSSKFSYNESDIPKYLNHLVVFFHLIEKKFKKKVLIVPHPKLRQINFKSNYNFFNNFKIFDKLDANEAVRQAYCVLINTVTTSISYAVLNYKPIFFLKSKITEFFAKCMNLNYIIERKKTLTSLNIKSLSIDKNHLINELNLKVNIEAYERYRFKYLQNSNTNLVNMHNSDIIINCIKKDLNF